MIRTSTALVAITTAALVLPLEAQPPERVRRERGFPVGFHDPSTPVRIGNHWWIFSTGRGVATRRSSDLKKWREGRPVFKEFPAWHKEVVPSQRGHLWAPDVIEHRGTYRLYYSVSSFGKQTSAIGLATCGSLELKRPGNHWKDRGIVVRSGDESPYNAIDPQIFVDANQRHWMAFGSFWKGIHLVELDPDTGKVHPKRGEFHHLAWNESIEAPAIMKRGRYHYLFVNWGLCCRGLKSTYEIRVGRSRSVTGPYLDKDGNDMATGGGTLLKGFQEHELGPGHPAFIEEFRDVRMFYHYYDRRYRGFSTLGHATLKWSKDGWPEL